MRITALITGIVLMAATSANAVFVGFDSAGNNTLGTADVLVSNTADWNSGSCALSADVGMASLSAGDVDFYKLTIPSGCILTAITTPLDIFPSSPDTVMGVWDSIGLANDNDDAGGDAAWSTGPAGPTRGSAVRYANDSGVAQMVWLSVSGYADFDFDGNDDFSGGPHPESGAYLLTVSLTPEPATLGLLLGGLVFFARRRK